MVYTRKEKEFWSFAKELNLQRSCLSPKEARMWIAEYKGCDPKFDNDPIVLAVEAGIATDADSLRHVDEWLVCLDCKTEEAAMVLFNC